MRVFVTGGAGFIGRAVVRQLRARGDTVTALTRDPARSVGLKELGAAVVPGDATADVASLRAQVAGHDAVVHLAGSYVIGIRPAQHPAMWAANVTAVERVIDASVTAGVPRIVHVSTANVYGNTRGRIVDEEYRRDPAEGFLSYYDETKVRGHEVALARIGHGAPVVIAMPGTVYGAGDHSAVGEQFRLAFEGRLPYRAVGDLGVTPTHVDDEADGIVRVLDRGRVGETYNLAGPPRRLAEGIEVAARLGGRRPPRLRVPTALMRATVPLAPILGGRFGFPANPREVLSASAGVTYWPSSEKASRELGFTARDLETGLYDWLVGGPPEPVRA